MYTDVYLFFVYTNFANLSTQHPWCNFFCKYNGSHVYNGVYLLLYLTIDHFRITFSLFFKASLGAHLFI